MTHPIRILADLPFRVLSPSLYALMLNSGTVALRYNGSKWEIVTISWDKPEQVEPIGSFVETVEHLDVARHLLEAVQ